MDLLQSAFESLLRAELSFRRLAVELIAKRLKDRGIELTRSQRATVESRLENLQGEDFTLAVAITDAQLAGSILTDEERTDRSISLDLDGNALISRIEEAVPAIVAACIDKASGLIFRRLQRDAPRMLKNRRRERRGFEARLAAQWGLAIDLLEMLREIAVEAGDDFNSEFRPEAAATRDCVFEVLTRLHARACQVASEVLTLLRSGHADGAHARWRSLHEIAVIGFFVKAHGDDVAERYILHGAIESYRAACLYQEHYAALGHEPLTEEEFAGIKATHDALKARFGDAYGEEYGWAAEALGKKRANFSDIERTIGLSHLRPYYKLASHNVHANPKGAFFKLGLLPDQQMLLAGPSNLGLADPGHGAAISLTQITVALLTMRPNIDRLVVCQILSRLEDEVGQAFIAAHRALEGTT